MVFHTDRKLFAYGFPYGMTPLYFIPTGNFIKNFSPEG